MPIAHVAIARQATRRQLHRATGHLFKKFTVVYYEQNVVSLKHGSVLTGTFKHKYNETDTE